MKNSHLRKYSTYDIEYNIMDSKKVFAAVNKFEENTQFSEYLQYYKSKGVETKDIAYGRCYLSGRQITSGIITREEIHYQDTLMKIPKSLIINSKVAFFSELHDMFLKHRKLFAPDGEVLQHLVLTVFLLFEESKGEKSKYYWFLRQIPENEDFVSSWTQEEISQLQDAKLQTEITHQNAYVTNISKYVCNILKNYPELFPAESLNPRKFTKYLVCVFTRSFGVTDLYTSLIPVADHLNHETTLCIFTTDDHYSQYLQSDEIIQFDDEVDEEIVYREAQINNLDQPLMISAFTEQESLKYLSMLDSKLVAIAKPHNEINLLFIAKISRIKSEIIENPKKIVGAIKKLLNKIDQFVIIQEKFMPDPPGPKAEQTTKTLCIDDKEWPDEPHEYFLVQNHSLHEIQVSAQLYACYGKLSNRQLLLRYGFVTQNNIYNYLNLELDVEAEIKNIIGDNNSFYSIRFRKNTYFQVRLTSFNTDILRFFRMIFWEPENDSLESIFRPASMNLEKKSLRHLEQFYAQILEKQYKPLPYYQEQMENPNLSSHLYFIYLYHSEKVRLLAQQLKLVQLCIAFLDRIIQCKHLENVWELVDTLEAPGRDMTQNRFLLHKYIQQFDL